MKVTIKTIKDTQIFTMDDNPEFLKRCHHCIRKGSPIKLTIGKVTYLINPANIVWVEISEEQGA